MSQKSVVTGEASETDSDEESDVKLTANMAKSIQGAVITGEDSESEDENNSSVSSAVSAMKISTIPENIPKKSDKHDSLLHRKLRECNITLFNDMEGYTSNSINEVKRTLSSVDHQLVQSQFMIQNSVTSLRELSNNSNNIKNKLQSLLSAKFLPNVIVNDESQT